MLIMCCHFQLLVRSLSIKSINTVLISSHEFHLLSVFLPILLGIGGGVSGYVMLGLNHDGKRKLRLRLGQEGNSKAMKVICN